MNELPQYPNIRACKVCPVCEQRKGEGLVICWTCNSNLKRRHDGGWGSKAEWLLNKVERILASIKETEHGTTHPR